MNTMKINALIMEETDNVATCVSDIKKGEHVVYRMGQDFLTLTAEEDIPCCHKIALKDFVQGDAVIKYGEMIGKSGRNIGKGCWVSHLNIESVPRDYGNEMISETDGLELSAERAAEKTAQIKKRASEELGETVEFLGYRRPDGRVGIRNHVLILPTCACASESCRIVAGQVRGAVNIVFNTGCSDVAANTAMSQKVLTGFALNPNVYGVVIIGLGCETVPHNRLAENIRACSDKPVVSFGIQEEGGTLKTIEKAVRAARDMASEAAMIQRVPCPVSDLLMGIECGGSDATSGIASNPAAGELSDLLTGLGGTTVMSETIEFIGGEHVLASRGATPEIHNRIIRICKEYEDHLSRAGQNCRAGQPTPGNKAGGLSTLEEKSLGCIRKGGTSPIVEVLEQAVPPSTKGAVIMDTAGYDISSVTSMAAGGCAAVVFTTGRGTPTGNAIVPVIKVTGNRATYEWMADNIDVDVSSIIDGTSTVRQSGKELFRELLNVCNGKMTKAEAYGFSDIAVDHVCRFV